MKQKKLFAAVIAVILIIFITPVLFTACDDSLQNKLRKLEDELTGYRENDAEKSIVIFIGDKKLETVTRENKMLKVLAELVESNRIGNLQYSGGEYGAMITELDGMIVDANHYIALYHTIDDPLLKTPNGSYDENWVFTPGEGFMTVEHAGITFFYSGVGATSLPIIDGANYRFNLETL